MSFAQDESVHLHRLGIASCPHGPVLHGRILGGDRTSQPKRLGAPIDEPRKARGGSERPHRLNVTSTNVEPNWGDRSMTSMATSGESRRVSAMGDPISVNFLRPSSKFQFPSPLSRAENASRTSDDRHVRTRYGIISKTFTRSAPF
jgi:hypothetical protein